jgi:hypothetical protein
MLGTTRLLPVRNRRIPRLYGGLLLACLWTVVQFLFKPLLSGTCDDNGMKDVCFVTCIFGDSVGQVDQPANVEWYRRHWCSARFDLVTNLPNLPAPGWNKHVSSNYTTTAAGQLQQQPYSNIVQSREAKFLAWKVLPHVKESCRAVVYLDGYLTPKLGTWRKFRRIAQQVQGDSEGWGLAQVKQPYFNGYTMENILNISIVQMHKDTTEHVQDTLEWMRQQDDYQEVMTYYLNKYLGTYVQSVGKSSRATMRSGSLSHFFSFVLFMI